MTKSATTPTIERVESIVRVGTRDIFVTQAGTGYPVVLLHGGGAGASGVSNYGRNIDALAAQYRVIVPDMPGYGQSSKGIDHSDPFGDLATTMRGLLDALDIEKAHFVGNSLGGATALRLALDRPDRVSRLVLMGPGGVGTSRALPTSGLSALLGYYTGAGPSPEKLERFVRDYLVYDAESVPAEMIQERYVASIDPAVVADPPLRRPSGRGKVKTLRRMDFTRDRRLAKLRTPTLVVWGANDKVNRPSGGRMLQDAIPFCDLYIVGRTGHWVQWERADMFNALTLEFLGRDS